MDMGQTDHDEQDSDLSQTDHDEHESDHDEQDSDWLWCPLCFAGFRAAVPEGDGVSAGHQSQDVFAAALRSHRRQLQRKHRCLCWQDCSQDRLLHQGKERVRGTVVARTVAALLLGQWLHQGKERVREIFVARTVAASREREGEGDICC